MPAHWTQEQIQALIKLYTDHTAAEIGTILGHPERAVANKAWKLGLRKDKQWRIERLSRNYFKPGQPAPNKGKTWNDMFTPEQQEKIRQNLFKPGQPAPNKGKTWNDMFTPEQQEKIRQNLFKPGSRPHKLKPVGYEMKNKNGYWMVKVEDPNVFKLKHRVLWEQHHGPIPEGITIAFADGNKDNITIENLIAETKLDRFSRCCSMHTTMPPQLRELYILKGQLKRQINKKENKGNERSD